MKRDGLEKLILQIRENEATVAVSVVNGKSFYRAYGVVGAVARSASKDTE